MKDRHKVVLRPMHPDKLAKRYKPEQVELMMRSGVVDHVRKGKRVLFSMSKEKPKEENNMPLVKLTEEHEVSSNLNVADQAPFMNPLDSRMNLSQLGENDANARDQVQAHLLRNQAHLESMEVAFDLSFGRVHFSFMEVSNSPKPRRPEVVKVPDDSECFLQS